MVAGDAPSWLIQEGHSSHQLHRMLGVSYKTAWFMTHRIRAAMRRDLPPMGGGGKTVEIDETYIGRLEGYPKARAGGAHKNVVLTLVERGGSARSFHIDSASARNIEPIMRANIARETALMTDEGPQYKRIGRDFASHESVNHSAKEYVRGHVTTNTVEGYYSIFKRGMKGVYQHCGEKHLHRYLAEFDFRYSNRIALGIGDKERVNTVAQGISGKRLTYRRAYKESDAAPF